MKPILSALFVLTLTTLAVGGEKKRVAINYAWYDDDDRETVASMFEVTPECENVDLYVAKTPRNDGRFDLTNVIHDEKMRIRPGVRWFWVLITPSKMGTFDLTGDTLGELVQKTCYVALTYRGAKIHRDK